MKISYQLYNDLKKISEVIDLRSTDYDNNRDLFNLLIKDLPELSLYEMKFEVTSEEEGGYLLKYHFKTKNNIEIYINKTAVDHFGDSLIKFDIGNNHFELNLIELIYLLDSKIITVMKND